MRTLMFNNGSIVIIKQTSPNSLGQEKSNSFIRNRHTRALLGAIAVPAVLVGAYDAGHRTRALEVAEMNGEHISARANVVSSAAFEAEQKTREIAFKKIASNLKVGVYVMRGEVHKGDMIVKDPLVLASEEVPAAAPNLDDERVTVYGAVKMRPNGKMVVRVLGDHRELDGVVMYTDGESTLGVREYVEATPANSGLRVPSEPEITPGLILTDKQ